MYIPVSFHMPGNFVHPNQLLDMDHNCQPVRIRNLLLSHTALYLRYTFDILLYMDKPKHPSHSYRKDLFFYSHHMLQVPDFHTFHTRHHCNIGRLHIGYHLYIPAPEDIPYTLRLYNIRHLHTPDHRPPEPDPLRQSSE